MTNAQHTHGQLVWEKLEQARAELETLEAKLREMEEKKQDSPDNGEYWALESRQRELFERIEKLDAAIAKAEGKP